MSAYTEAMARLSSGYYNANPKTPTNPGGLGGYGHITNLFLLKADLATVIAEVAPAANLIFSAEENAAAAQRSADDALASYNALVAKASFFKSLTPAEVRAFLDNEKFLGALSLIQAAKSEPLAYAATMTPSRLDGWSRHVTLTGNAVLANPTDFVAGQSGRFRFEIGGAGGWVLGFGTSWRLPPDMDDLASAPGSINTMPYYVHAPNDIEAAIVRGWA